MTSLRRRESWFLCGAAVLALALPAVLAHHLDRRLHRDLEVRLSDRLGVGVEIGSIEASLTGTLRLERVTIARVFAADAVEASVALTSLLGGRIQADEVRLDRPRLHIRIDRDGHSNLERLLRRAAAARHQRVQREPRRGNQRPRTPPRIVVTRGDLVVDLGGRGELHLGGVTLHPQAGGVRVVAGATTLHANAGAWTVAGQFDRGAADLSLPQVGFDRILAVGGELTISAPRAAATELHEVTLAHRLAAGREIELSGRAARAGADARFTARATTRGDGVAVTVAGDGLPLAALAPLLPRAFDLRTATATGHATVELAAGELAGIDADADLVAIGVDDRRIAASRFDLAGHVRLLAAVTVSEAGRELQLDEAELTTGALTVSLAGHALVPDDRGLPERGALDLEVSPVGCMDAFTALPEPFTRRLAGLYATGTARASLHLVFDRTSVEDTALEVDVDLAGCRVASEASEADPRMLTQPFGHIFPDGSTALIGSEAGDYATLRSLPAHVAGAFVAAEDARFFDHHGFDTHQIERSLAIDLVHGRFARGGSTISQQLVKNVFLSPERSIARKFQEAILTWRLEQHLDKRLILERYLNIIELGNGVFGITAATRHWFGKEPRALTVAEAAFLAALTPAPRTVSARIRAAGGIDPATSRQVAVVLRHMRRAGVIGDAAYEQARSTHLTLRGPLVAAR